MSTWITIYSWSLPVIYLLVDTVLVVAALLAARHPTFRRPFALLATAGALSVFCAAVTLLLRLHLTFHFSAFTVGMRRAALLLHDIAELGSIFLYCVGFILLVSRIRSLPHPSSTAAP